MSARLQTYLQRIDPAVATAFGCIIVLLLLGSLVQSNFLSPEYLLQQLKVASFLGVIATGMFIIILLGQIDLSVPWVVAAGGMMAAAMTAYGPVGATLAIPVRHLVRCRLWTDERLRRRLYAHSLDDRDARRQRRGARLDGRPHRRVFAAGCGVGIHAFHRDGRYTLRHSQCT